VANEILTAEPPEFRYLKTPERSRTYHFPGNDTVKVTGVNAIAISERGTHRLETLYGEKVVVRCGWLALNIDADDWEF
jgi:hypothetical protein